MYVGIDYNKNKYIYVLTFFKHVPSFDKLSRHAFDIMEFVFLFFFVVFLSTVH